jgi:hypothetical protein
MEEPIRKSRAERMKEEGLAAHKKWLASKKDNVEPKTNKNNAKG